jgi:hypothetical protein
MIFALIVIAIVLIVLIRLELNAQYIVKLFRHGNVIVWGKKRKGKDLLFQKVINMRKKETYMTNYPDDFNYGHKGKHVKLEELSVNPNIYDDMITEKVKKIQQFPEREKVDVYISDAGIYLPSQFHGVLNKTYPSMPIYYSVIGHLYDSNIHVNYNGSISRLWDKLREQADDYLKVLRSIKLPFIIFTQVRYYEEYNSAEAGLLPMKNSLLNTQQRALYQQYVSENGLIKNMWIVQLKKNIHYDTRYFRRLFFNIVE